jgi:hypothetical protein
MGWDGATRSASARLSFLDVVNSKRPYVACADYAARWFCALVGEQLHLIGYGETECRGGLEVDRRDQIIALANRSQIATMCNLREYVVAGGLISYAPSITEVYRQAGICREDTEGGKAG